MDCLICKQRKTQLGTTTITLERAGTSVVFKNVPAQVCENCGEAYVDEETSGKLLEAAEEAARSGVLVGVREYTAAVVGTPQERQMPKAKIWNSRGELISALLSAA